MVPARTIAAFAAGWALMSQSPPVMTSLRALVLDPLVWVLASGVLLLGTVVLGGMLVADGMLRDGREFLYRRMVPFGVLTALVLAASVPLLHLHNSPAPADRWAAPRELRGGPSGFEAAPGGDDLERARARLAVTASDEGAEQLRATVRLAGGRECSVLANSGLGDPSVAVACTNGREVEVGRFTGPVPGPSSRFGPVLDSAGSLVPGSSASWDDAYGYLDDNDEPHLVAPTTRPLSALSPQKVPSKVVVFDRDGTTRVLGSDAVLPGPSVAGSSALDLAAAVASRRRLGAPVYQGRTPALEWRDGRPWWVVPVAPDDGRGAVVSVLEVSGRTGPGGRPEVVVRRLAGGMPAAGEARRLVEHRTGKQPRGPGRLVQIDGSDLWLFRTEGGSAAVTGDSTVCTLSQRTPLACLQAVARSDDDGPTTGQCEPGEGLGAVPTPELIEQRDRIQGELDRRAGAG
jgi:hypothetical protein